MIMTPMKCSQHHSPLILMVVAFFAALMSFGALAATQFVAVDGLEQLKAKGFDKAYMKPSVTFAGYSSILIEQAPVSFRKRWEHDQRVRYKSSITDKDMDRIKSRAQKSLHEELVKRFEKDAKFKLVSAAGEGVLKLKPQIVDLDVHAPDVDLANKKSFITSAGSARLVLEVLDAESDEKLAVLIDRRDASFHPSPIKTSRVVNNAEMRSIYRAWAKNISRQLQSNAVAAVKKKAD